MYGCEAWTVTFKEENQVLLTERKVLRKFLGPTKEMMAAGGPKPNPKSKISRLSLYTWRNYCSTSPLVRSRRMNGGGSECEGSFPIIYYTCGD